MAWISFSERPLEEQDRMIRDLALRTNALVSIHPRTRQGCACCGVIHEKADMRRQMMFVPVTVCTTCVSKMETPS